MKSILVALAVLGLAGCSDQQGKGELAQKLDLLLSNQAAINAKLDALPKYISDTGNFYSSNEIAYVFRCHTNQANAMLIQADSIESVINEETRRVGVVVLTNAAGFQSDTMRNIEIIKLVLQSK